MEEQALSGRRLLIVEDEYLIAMDVEQMCRDFGAVDVVICGTAQEMAQLDKGVRFDAAILDFKVDGVPTVEFAQALKLRNIPFIFATGYSDREMFGSFPGVPVVGKPYAGTELVAALVSVIGASKGTTDTVV